MKKLLISVKPIYCEAILLGRKKYEYRTKVAVKVVSSMLLYETAPTKVVVGEVKILGVLSGTPSEIWNKTKEGGGITKKAFFSYFKHRKVAYAYVLGKAQMFREKRSLSFYGIERAPQSYRYI